ncbi:IclR family transcriptional regulator [Pelagicoccus sp. SDUM812005]|uniref:IclR family transcriptional regulator n=1 Tax=Pelagicoccus sp. SDUM812005 TaxID=3041257 RepID=UPI00280D3BC4|nr:IclR family transcriptional regulator [Pelagicoccus sp. SDUM812005]MDQ8183827.1 IclR family transcriptional regulator [Pelagicoccus sp. SDUM812005]
MKAAGNIDLRAAARPVLQALTSSSDETCHLAVWDQGRALIIEVSECSHPLSAASKPGTRAYVHASSTGKVLLAYLFIEELESVWAPQDRVSLTRNTTTSVQGLRAELAKVLKNGYALDDEEYHVGVRCVAAPVFSSDGRVCAGVGITASSARFTKRRVGELSKLVKQAAADISRLLGWKG